VGIPDGEKKFEDRPTISRFERIHERDGQRDGRTPRDSIGSACIASRSNKPNF